MTNQKNLGVNTGYKDSMVTVSSIEGSMVSPMSAASCAMSQVPPAMSVVACTRAQLHLSWEQRRAKEGCELIDAKTTDTA
jgi:hypothetical protein